MVFSVYCGISIMHSLVYRKIQEAQARNQLVNELMIYHMKVCAEKYLLASVCLKIFDIKSKEKLSIHFSFSSFEDFLITTIALHMGVM